MGIFFNAMKKPSRKTLKAKCDRLFSEKVRQVGMCELAGLDDVQCNGNLQCMHIVGRAHHALRWDSFNAICGCAAHHIFYTNNPTLFAMVISENWPEQWAYLQEHRNEFWDKDLDKVYEMLVDWRPNE